MTREDSLPPPSPYGLDPTTLQPGQLPEYFGTLELHEIGPACAELNSKTLQERIESLCYIRARHEAVCRYELTNPGVRDLAADLARTTSEVSAVLGNTSERVWDTFRAASDTIYELLPVGDRSLLESAAKRWPRWILSGMDPSILVFIILRIA